MLAIGFLTPLASAAVIGVMNQAVRTVHLDKGFFASNGGYEFAADRLRAPRQRRQLTERGRGRTRVVDVMTTRGSVGDYGAGHTR